LMTGQLLLYSSLFVLKLNEKGKQRVRGNRFDSKLTPLGSTTCAFGENDPMTCLFPTDHVVLQLATSYCRCRPQSSPPSSLPSCRRRTSSLRQRDAPRSYRDRRHKSLSG
jgi:hypothetical protein